MEKEKYHSLILTSGTLKPLETFGKELGIKFDHRIENKHVIDCDQIKALTLGEGCNRSLLVFSH